MCESHPIVIEGLRAALRGHPELELVGAAAPAEAPAAIGALRPDVVLVSQQPDLEATFALLAQVRAALPSGHLVLWAADDSLAEQARAFDWVRAIARKSLPTAALLECLSRVGRGEDWAEPSQRPEPPLRPPAPRLTKREREVVRLVCQGMKNKDIARALGIAAGTVKVHLTHIFEKTGVQSRFDLALRGRKWAGNSPDSNCGPYGVQTSEPLP